MPSVSKKQHNLMAMVAHDPKAAKRLKIPQSVGQEFVKADKGRTFKSGAPWMGAAFAAKLKAGVFKMAGLMKRLFRGTESAAEEKAEARAVRSGKITPKQYVAGEKSEGETEPGMMARAKALKSGKMSPAAYAKHEATEKMKKGGCATKKMACGGKAKKMAKGGGVEAKGKTAGKTVKMAKGGGVEVKGKTKGRMV